MTKPSFFAKENECEGLFLHHKSGTAWRHQCIKLCIAWKPVSRNLWAPFELRVRKYRSPVAIHCDDVNMSLYYASRTNDFFGDSSSLTHISSSLSSEHVFWVFSSCLERNVLPENFSRNFISFCLEREHEETSAWIYDDISFRNRIQHMHYTLQKREIFHWITHCYRRVTTD